MGKGGFQLSKKDFPGLERVKDETGRRVWQYQGKLFLKKRDVFNFDPPSKRKEKNEKENSLS